MNAPDALTAYRPLIGQGRWFSTLPPERQEQLLEHAVVQKVPAGAALFLRGDANSGLYCLVEGSLLIGAVSADAREATLGLLEPPQWFGEIALFDDGPRTHDAHARVASRLLLVPRPALLRLLAAEPQWWHHLGQLLAEKVRALFESLEDMAVLAAPARVARRLLAMATGHGMLAPGITHLTIAVNQEQLGAMLSLTRQTISEVLREFEAQGWLKRRYGAIELLDTAALSRIGQPQGMAAAAGAAAAAHRV